MPDAPAKLAHTSPLTAQSGQDAGVVRSAPPTELLRALALLAEPPGPHHAAVAELICPGTPAEASEYADVFMFQLYPYASVYLGPEGMLGGDARARISGFWQAVGREPPVEPDHLASMIGLYVALAEEEAEGRAAESTLGHQARRALLFEHLAPWVFFYLTRIKALGSDFFSRWAEVFDIVLRDELLGFGPPSDLPAHFRAGEALPDPRTEGGDAFLSGLLAPARSGMILTRADLARVAGQLGLGLRAGERRYALEHLMGQDPEGVLEAFAAEAESQRAGHEGRRPWLGASAAFLETQARTTAELLGALQHEAAEPLVTTAS